MRKLNVKKTTTKEVSDNWGFTIPFIRRYNGEKRSLYARCNAKGIVNWNTTAIYTADELVDRGNYIVHE